MFSASTSQCGACHAGYNQNLDILEGNAANQLPTTLSVGQTATVTVLIENSVNTATYTALSSVSLTLSSANGHFTVSAPTYTIGTLQKGTATATWQITGVSAGTDTFVIAATAKNSHQSLSFQDTYSPAPAITIQSPASTPSPTPIPTAAPTQSPTSTNRLPDCNPKSFIIYTNASPNTFPNINLRNINPIKSNINTNPQK